MTFDVSNQNGVENYTVRQQKKVCSISLLILKFSPLSSSDFQVTLSNKRQTKSEKEQEFLHRIVQRFKLSSSTVQEERREEGICFPAQIQRVQYPCGHRGP